VNSSFTESTLRAYESWAPSYAPVAHNPLMRSEERAMLELWPDVSGRRILDLACGTGRYSRLLAETGAADITAVDFCPPMLDRVALRRRVCADMMHLPFANAAFDAVISGLAIGHAPDVHAWMAEIARVIGDGGALLYSDFHPEAARAGLPRTFKDADNRTITVPHRSYSVDMQRQAAEAAMLTIESCREIRVGIELKETFSNSDEFYRRWRGLPIVLIVKARK
jgi:ubiquinone/menaquinone biosynthesis C-methylase UbiE